MLRSVKSLYGYAVMGTDGMIGSVYELYFLDDSWDIAYVVVRIGGLMHRRKILIQPSLFDEVNIASNSIPVALTKDQASHFPGIESDLPVSSFKVKLLWEYYELPAMAAAGGIMTRPVLPPPLSRTEEREIEYLEGHRNPHLRRTREVVRYHLKVKNGPLCPIDDIIMDDKRWSIVYFEAATGGWLNKRKVFIESANVTRIGWGEQQVTAELRNVAKRSRKHLPRLRRKSKASEGVKS
jgi:hypothetical protein